MNLREIETADFDRVVDELRADGFRLDVIYPADDPASAVLSRGEEKVRVARPDAQPLPKSPPPFRPEFLVTRAVADAGQGRAGMLYRDLIPGRLGGRYIASHITIPAGGPVADWVHYHRLSLQLIFVRRGWVKVVYEDQGEPFLMQAGDLVLQPPLVRHRVLESSAGLEVIEISAPALHETFADHVMQLPNGRNPDRIYGGQRFLRHIAAETSWTPAHGGEAQETDLMAATSGLAAVRTLRPLHGDALTFGGHRGELVFGFVLDGSATLDHRGLHEVGTADAFVIPPGLAWRLRHPSPDFRLLHVTTTGLD